MNGSAFNTAMYPYADTEIGVWSNSLGVCT